MIRIWGILTQALKSLRDLPFDWFLLRKVYNYIILMQSIYTFDLKKYRGVIFHATEEYAKFEGKLTCGLDNDKRNLANCHQSTRKSQNCNFDGIPLSKVENV